MLRLFIAIPVPQNIKEQITSLVADLKNIQGLPKNIRFMPPENWHFTLVFLGYQPETAIPVIEKALVASGIDTPIYVEFDKLIYGPPQRTPRMIWLTTSRETSAKLGVLKTFLEDKLVENGIKWQREMRPFQGHLTLARFEPRLLKDLPLISQNLSWRYENKEIHLMKSTLKRTGAEYEVLSSVSLNPR